MDDQQHREPRATDSVRQLPAHCKAELSFEIRTRKGDDLMSASEGGTPRRWRKKDEQGEDLIAFWKSFAPHSNEVAAADIIEELERELAKTRIPYSELATWLS
jgi:hypothetical protein